MYQGVEVWEVNQHLINRYLGERRPRYHRTLGATLENLSLIPKTIMNH